MEAVKEFVGNCVEYLKANPVYAIIIAAALVFIIVVLIVVISLSAKRKKAKKQAAKQDKAQTKDEKAMAAIAAEKEQAAKEREEKAKAEAEKQAAARAEVEAKLEAQRLEAEREEAEKLAAEKAKAEEEAKAKAEAEKPVETKAKPAAKKTTKKKAEPVKEEAKAEEAQEEKAEAEEVKEETPAPAPKKAKKSPAKQAEVAEEAKEEATTDAQLYDELKDAEEEDDVWYDEDETEKFARYAGKWAIYHILTDDHNNSDDDMYFFELHASNGEKLLSSEEYTTYAGALRGIETHKTNILKGNFKITLSKKGDYIFKLLSGKNMLLCMGENYPSKARCESAIKSAKRFAKTAIIDENVQDYVLKVPTEDETYVEPPADGYNGKWLISSREDGEGEKVYFFELFANNGEKLLSSEEYTTYIGAVNGIQTHKTNIAKGNFRISLTKRGDYIYKLLNGNGQLLCLGEHYKTKARCQSAVESVKRFASNSPVLTDSDLVK